MIEKRIFYSWQSDLNHEFNWKLIESCLNTSINSVNQNSKHFHFSVDLATRGLPGSPDIVDSIFKKIENSNIFIGDTTPITVDKSKGLPNPNVLIELGFAVNVLGWDNIICIHNKFYGTIEQLPFDIKQRRITTYQLGKQEEKTKQAGILSEIFNVAIPLIHEQQADLDDITQIFKLKLDHILLSLTNHFNFIFDIKESLIGVDVFNDVLDKLAQGFLDGKEIRIDKTEELLSEKISELEDITKHPLLILNKKIKQITSIMKLIDTLKLLRNNILSNRFYNSTLKSGQSKLNEIGVVNLLLSDISDAIDNILANWGGEYFIESIINVRNQLPVTLE